MKPTLPPRLLALALALMPAAALAEAPGSHEISWHDISQPLLWWAGALLVLVLTFAIAGGWRPRHDQPSSSRALPWIVFTLLVALGVPVWEALNDTPSSPTDLQITCTASQWKWHFDYTDYEGANIDGPSFVSAMRTPPSIDSDILARQLFSTDAKVANPDDLLEVDQPMVLPAGRRVRFTITSDDSVHAWWIPGLAIKKDAIPGFVQSVDVQLPAQTGLFRGMCSQMCGQDHAFMPIVVKIVSPAEFTAWLAQTRTRLASEAQRQIPQTLTDDRLFALGAEVYRDRCALCHLSSGDGATSRVPPLTKSPAVHDDSKALVELIAQGRNVMPGMNGILARDEIAAVATFVRVQFGNVPPAQASVQPAQLHNTQRHNTEPHNTQLPKAF